MDLYNEDCLEGLKKLEENSVDLIICDLPYGVTNISWDQKIDLKQLSEQLWRVAKKYCSIIFTCKYFSIL